MATSLSKSESSYIAAALLSTPTPTRADGRGLLDFRAVSIETGVAALANGSGRAIIGGGGSDAVGTGEVATEAIVATRLEVEEIEEGTSGFSCSVTCTPSAYPHHSFPQLDDLSSEVSLTLHQCLASVIVSPQLIIVPKKKRWHLALEAIIISDAGNVLDALVIAARAALWDLRIPKTRGLEYQGDKPKPTVADEMEVDETKDAFKSALQGTRQTRSAVDFELEDYWDDGAPLDSREGLPVCVTLNILAPIHFLDATQQEERSAPTKLHLTFAFPPSAHRSSSTCILLNTRISGPSEVPIKLFPSLLKDGEKYARELNDALNAKLASDDKRRANAALRL